MPLSDQYLLDVTLKRDLVPSFGAYPFHLDAVRSLRDIEHLVLRGIPGSVIGRDYFRREFLRSTRTPGPEVREG